MWLIYCSILRGIHPSSFRTLVAAKQRLLLEPLVNNAQVAPQGIAVCWTLLSCRLPSSYRVTAVGSLYTLTFRILITSRDQEITFFRNVTQKSDLPALVFFRLVSAMQVEQFPFLQVPVWSLHFLPSAFGILLLGYTEKKNLVFGDCFYFDNACVDCSRNLAFPLTVRVGFVGELLQCRSEYIRIQ